MHGLHMNQKRKEQTAGKITNAVKDTLCGEKINLIKLQCKEDIITEGAGLRDEDGVSKEKLPKDSQRNSKPHKQGTWDLKTNGETKSRPRQSTC